MKPLHALADMLGIVREWWTVDGEAKTVSDQSLVRISSALGYPAETEALIASSLQKAEEDRLTPPKMLVGVVGEPIPLPANLTVVTITFADGSSHNLDVTHWSLPPIEAPGYYPLSLNGHELTLAIAPQKCPSVEDLGKGRIWGAALQIPALRGDKPQSFGTFSELVEAAEKFAELGADTLAINPVHALFSGYGKDFSPYSPSSRLFLNTAMGAPELLGLSALHSQQSLAELRLIDWPNALPDRLAALRSLFASLDNATLTKVAQDNAPFSEGLKRQALYDALDARFRPTTGVGFQNWPACYQNPDSDAVAQFAKENSEEIEFHLFTQWLARESLAIVQQRAKQAGMAIGLFADLAVGVHLGGADAWSMGETLLQGLTIGAPPDPLGPLGQNWNLTGFSPQGLRNSGYGPWIETIRAALSTAGALRIDHAFGLSRLWVIPEGCPSSEGAYLKYPFEDLIRLVALEAYLADAIIVAEDLGTMPEGFEPAISNLGMIGMRVLWFERAEDGGFIGASDYTANAVSMSGTHDTATIAGWWSGKDLDWAEKLGRLPEGSSRSDAESQRDWDRGLLWATLTHDTEPRPSPDNVDPVIAAALRHIGRAPCGLAIVPLEDLIAEKEQPNLPGIVTEHPNWRYRLNQPVSDLLSQSEVQNRISILNSARKMDQDIT